ncbi:hypothetical protein JXA88_00060 [Candidatus Fermentibacteria bacterium]|nr:hypothetical protein [Candidatus Fermentibacteria bacterium]
MTSRLGAGVACLVTIVALSCGVAAGQPQAMASGPVTFEYGIVGRTASRQDSLFAVQDGVAMHSGDQIRIILHRMLDTFVYVIIQMANGDYSLFHASRGEQEGETLRSLPWLRLDDNTGVETIHMVASAAPLAGLKETFELYGAARGARRAELAADIAARLAPVRETPGGGGEGLMPLARMGNPTPLGWNYRGPFNEEDTARYLFTRCVGDSVAADRVRIIHE